MKRLNISLILLFVIALVLLSAYNLLFLPKSKTYPMMGTTVAITVDGPFANSHIIAAFNRMKEIEEKLNRYNPRSEISLINRAQDSAKVVVSPDTFNCIKQALNVSKLTNGAFDITLSGNYKNIVLDEKTSSVRMKKPGITLNLDGIGKGYAVEEARRLLFKRGVKSGMIDMRSSIAVLSGPWKIGIKNPDNINNLLGIFVLTDEAISTSGTYEQGKHIVDPKTKKRPDGIVSLTIAGHDAGFLDGLSTGIFVLGPNDGVKLAKKLKLRMVMLTKDRKIIKL